jgi:histidyl-tRNA synthetase
VAPGCPALRLLEYDGPPLEPLELYVEKSGAEIVEQLYAFTDKGGRQVALRPEMTPSLARMLGERSRGMSKPIRWFSVPQLFRYERQQRGRLREHFQWNVDIVGEEGVAADAEVLAVAIDGLRELGLGAGGLPGSRLRPEAADRGLLAAGCGGRSGARGPARVVDKLEREPRERSAEGLVSQTGLSARRRDRVLDAFDDPTIFGRCASASASTRR